MKYILTLAVILCLTLTVYAEENVYEENASLSTLDEMAELFPLMSGLDNTNPPIDGGVLFVGIAGLETNYIFNPVFARIATDFSFMDWFSGGSIFNITPQQTMGQDGIATWVYDIEERSITITQVEDVYWHDGVPLTLDDLVFAMETIATPGYAEAGGARWTNAQQNIVGTWEFHNGEKDYISGLILSEDKRELKIYFYEFTPLLKHFGFWTTPYPRHIFQDVPMNEQPTHYHTMIRPIGWGPFIVEEVLANEAIILSANENFWLGRPYLDFVVISRVHYYTGARKMQNGELDIVIRTHPSFFEGQGIHSHYHYLGDMAGTFGYIAFNLGNWDYENNLIVPNENARMADVNLRRAMAYAMDFNYISSWASNLRMPATSVVPPNQRAFIDPSITGFVYNPEYANFLLDEAGFLIGSDGWRTFPDGSELLIRLVIDYNDIPLGNSYQDAWSNVGLNSYLYLVSFAEIVENIFNADHWEWDVVSAAWGAGANPDPNNFWGHTRSNIPRFMNEAFESHLQGFHSPEAWDMQWLINHYHEWQRLFEYYVPAILTTWRINLTSVNNRVINFYIGISEDGLRTKGGLHRIQVTNHEPYLS